MAGTRVLVLGTLKNRSIEGLYFNQDGDGLTPDVLKERHGIFAFLRDDAGEVYRFDLLAKGLQARSGRSKNTPLVESRDLKLEVGTIVQNPVTLQSARIEEIVVLLRRIHSPSAEASLPRVALALEYWRSYAPSEINYSRDGIPLSFNDSGGDGVRFGLLQEIPGTEVRFDDGARAKYILTSDSRLHRITLPNRFGQTETNLTTVDPNKRFSARLDSLPDPVRIGEPPTFQSLSKYSEVVSVMTDLGRIAPGWVADVDNPASRFFAATAPLGVGTPAAAQLSL